MVETLLSQWHWDTFPMALGHYPNGVGIPPQWHWGTTLPSIGHRGFKQQMFLS
ncbi:MAG: hypothetical protein J6V33_09845 [Bacteroidales bacterium]|nr:hypothetical protein [Bacteroidales bacterium]